MSTSRKPPEYIQLVRSPASKTPTSSDVLARSTWQKTLFASANSGLLCFVNPSLISETELLRVLLEGKPKLVLDMRLVPTFDVGSLNRRLVFGLFDQIGAKYVDVSGMLKITSRRDSKLNPRLLVQEMERLIGPITEGPVVLLAEAEQFAEEYVSSFVSQAQHWRKEGWELLIVPEQSERPSARARRTVFVSHANPEENEFVRWLVTQLTLLGYEVWSDLTRLIGGSYFWTSIEDAIRNHSAKVVVVLSRAAQTKAGVLDEINCALSVERREKISEFVIPIRVDDLPFDEVIANLARKNVLDFSRGWMAGLAALEQALAQGGVPRGQVSAQSASVLWSSTVRARELIRAQERLTSNWLSVEEMPKTIHLYSVGESAEFDTQLLPNVSSQESRILDVEAALSSGGSGRDFRTVANLVTSLMKCGWESCAAERGLKRFDLSGRRSVWFVPSGLIPGDSSSFRGLDGKSHRKILVGRSEKRRAYWHYGVELRPTFSRNARFALYSHVIFTSDGQGEFFSPERMHALRRGFCKSWWNDRWRDLELAFLSWIAPTRKLELKLTPVNSLLIDCRPVSFSSPVSLMPSTSDRFDALLSDVEWEELDTDDLDPSSELEESAIDED